MAKNVLRGRNLILKYNGSAIPVSTSCKLSLGTSTVDSTTKDDKEDWEEVDVLTENWSVSAGKLLQVRIKRNTGTLLTNAVYRPDTKTVNIGSKFHITMKTAPIDTGSMTNAIWLGEGDRIAVDHTYSTPPDVLCYAEEIVLNGEAEVVHAFTPGHAEYTASKGGYYFIKHHEDSPSHTDTYTSYIRHEAFAEILTDAPIEAEVEFDIEGETYTGNVLITQNDLDGTVKQNATQSISMQGTGPLVKK